jgi:hypothetical protein
MLPSFEDMKRSTLVIPLVALLFACAKKEEPLPAASTGLVPLKVGNSWTYIDSTFNSNGFGSSDTSLLKITGSKTITWQGKPYLVFLWTWVNPIFPQYSFFAGNESDGLYFFGGTNGHTDYVIAKSLFGKFPVTEGESWMYERIGYGLHDSSFYVDDTLPVQCISVGFPFKTAAGTVSSFVYRETDTGPVMLSPLRTGLAGFTDATGSTMQTHNYFNPAIGFVGMVKTFNGELRFRKTLLSYHLN